MKRIALFFATVLMTLSINAQSGDTPAPHMFVSLQGGATQTYTHSALDRKWAPMGALSIGTYFTNVIGARLQANGWAWKQDFANYKGNLHSYLGCNADLLVNLTNLFDGERAHRFEVAALAGFGVHKDHLDHEDYPVAGVQEHVKADIYSLNLRAGGQLGYNLSRSLQLQLEGGVHKVNDGNNPADVFKKWWPYVMGGIAYNFAYKKQKKTEPVIVEEVIEEPAPTPIIEEPKPQPQPQPQPQPKPEPAKIGKNIFFDLGKSVIRAEQESNLDAIAQFAKEHPSVKLSLVGYADKETGNPRINGKLSEERAKAVKAALVKRGVAADRINADWKGDTVQPFAKNDENRVVIVLGEE